MFSTNYLSKRSISFKSFQFPNINKKKYFSSILIIPSYKESSYNNHDPRRKRKLLLNKREIKKLLGRINMEGYTLIPTKLYFKKGKAKVEIAVAKGKKQYDKRETKKKRDWNRDRARFFRKSS